MEPRQFLPSGLVLDGSYEIRRVLGAGGFGITYEAFDHGLGRPVAVKEYYPEALGRRESTQTVRPRTESDRPLFDKLRQSFVREAQTLSQFNHSSIVRVLRVFEAHGTAYMVMSLEAGPTLKQWLASLRRQPTQSELDRIVEPLLGALETLHQAHFLHRDIAPDNIILRHDGTPVLLDFGAARRVLAEATGTLTGLVKKGYSPLEQYAVETSAQGPWSDVYALGATLYKAVMGRELKEATLRSLDDTLPRATMASTGGYRPEFLAGIDAATALRPEHRPQTMAALRRLLLAPAPAAVGPTAYLPAASTAVAPANAATRARLADPPRQNARSEPGAGVAPAPPAKAEFFASLPIAAVAGVALVGAVLVAAGGYLAGRTFMARPETSQAPVPSVSRTETTAEAALKPVPAAPKPPPAAAPGDATRDTVRQLAKGASPPTTPRGPCKVVETLVAGARKCLAVGDVFQDCPTCPEMVVVPAGSFMMGAPESEAGSGAHERPVHKVAIARPFAIGRYEVTRKEYEALGVPTEVSSKKGCTNIFGTAPGQRRIEPGWSFENPGYFQSALEPVVCLSWTEATQFAQNLSKRTAQPYRLPTEAEWEYAARAGSQEPYFFGTDEKRLCEYGNVATTEHPSQLAARPLVDCKDYSARTQAVGIFKPNTFGLHDTIGNVWEWVADCSVPNFAGAPGDGTAFRTPACVQRVARGGGWGSIAATVRTANRWPAHEPDIRIFSVGFRVARTLE